MILIIVAKVILMTCMESRCGIIFTCNDVGVEILGSGTG